jgi:hypothetical protein
LPARIESVTDSNKVHATCSITDVDVRRWHCIAEFDADFALVQTREFVLPDHLMIHDWTFTDSHYVLLGNRIRLDIPGTEGDYSTTCLHFLFTAVISVSLVGGVRGVFGQVRCWRSRALTQ